MFEKIVTAILCTILSAQVFANANTNVCENELRDRIYSRMDNDVSYAAMVEHASPRIAKGWRQAHRREEGNVSGYRTMVLSAYEHIIQLVAPGLNVVKTHNLDDLCRKAICNHDKDIMIKEHDKLRKYILKGAVDLSVDTDECNSILPTAHKTNQRTEEFSTKLNFSDGESEQRALSLDINQALLDHDFPAVRTRLQEGYVDFKAEG